MMQTIAEWYLQPNLNDARKAREEVAHMLQKEGATQIDAFQLACSELIVNLSRYPEPKPTEVILTLSKDEQYLWLELRDNGPSFNRFSQLVNNPQTLEAAESGMGLKLLAQMFPDMRYVPACYRADAKNLMLLRQPINTGVKIKPSLLIVDDDPSYRAIITAYLSGDYHVIQAEGVSEAFSLLLQHKPALVICDIQMPGQDGPALFDQIAHIPDVADTAFIYLSGCQEVERISAALTRPVDDFLAKPVSRDLLLNYVNRVLSRKRYLTDQIKNELEQEVTLGLKPDLPDEIPGYRLQIRSINPTPGGGDLVQLRKSNRHCTLLMADLMGHGLAAKGFSYALAGYLRGLISASCNDNIELKGLFSLISKGFDSDPVLQQTLATLIAVKMTASGDMTLVNAGQPLPILQSKNSLTPVDVKGPLPGMNLSDYEEVSIELKPGQRVIMFSDGVIDAGRRCQKIFYKLHHSVAVILSPQQQISFYPGG